MEKLLSFWKKISNTKSLLAIAGAVILILQTLGLNIDAPYINEVAKSICALLVLLGIINDTGMNTTKWGK